MATVMVALPSNSPHAACSATASAYVFGLAAAAVPVHYPSGPLCSANSAKNGFLGTLIAELFTLGWVGISRRQRSGPGVP
jgi:hypothetical protein